MSYCVQYIHISNQTYITHNVYNYVVVFSIIEGSIKNTKCRMEHNYIVFVP